MWVLHLTNCKKCGNVFHKSWTKCKHCGARRALNYQIIVTFLLLLIIALLILLTLKA